MHSKLHSSHEAKKECSMVHVQSSADDNDADDEGNDDVTVFVHHLIFCTQNTLLVKCIQLAGNTWRVVS